MKRTLLALWGTSNSGKSTTIKRVYGLLRSKHKDAEIIHSKFGRDFVVILLIKGKKIGIESQGDPNGRLGSSLERFVREKCNVIICATRTRGQTVDAVNDLAKRYKVIWFEQVKSISSKHQASNHAMAREMCRAAENAIK
jgi:predicted kinase